MDNLNLNLNIDGIAQEPVQTPAAIAAGFILSVGDGKGKVIPENHRMVKIAEKKVGKGKGKTVSFCIIPVIAANEYQENFTAVIPMLNELCEELQRDIATRMQRDGIKAITPADINIPACILEWTNRTFSAETVGAWFDAEVSDMLALQIATAKGWDISEIDKRCNLEFNWEAFSPSEGIQKQAQKNAFEKKVYLETKCAAYRASYVETAAKFPSLNPSQCTELARVIELLELSGPIVSRIRDKIVPKETNSSLGF